MAGTNATPGPWLDSGTLTSTTFCTLRPLSARSRERWRPNPSRPMQLPHQRHGFVDLSISFAVCCHTSSCYPQVPPPDSSKMYLARTCGRLGPYASAVESLPLTGQHPPWPVEGPSRLVLFNYTRTISIYPQTSTHHPNTSTPRQRSGSRAMSCRSSPTSSIGLSSEPCRSVSSSTTTGTKRALYVPARLARRIYTSLSTARSSKMSGLSTRPPWARWALPNHAP